MIEVEEKKDSSKEEQLQKMGQLINTKDNESGEVLVEERGAAAAPELPITSKKGVTIKHLTLCIAQAPLQAGMEALGGLTAFLLQNKVTYTLQDFVVVWLTP